MALDFPDAVKITSIGKSWENRDISMIVMDGKTHIENLRKDPNWKKDLHLNAKGKGVNGTMAKDKNVTTTQKTNNTTLIQNNT